MKTLQTLLGMAMFAAAALGIAFVIEAAGDAGIAIPTSIGGVVLAALVMGASKTNH